MQRLPIGMAFVAALLSSAVPAIAHDPRIEEAVDRAVRPLLKAHDVPGIAVAVTVDGRQLFFNYGVAARDGKIPVTRNTLFEIGSVSKTFTATLATYAQAQGALSLEDRPSAHMPALGGGALDAARLLHLGTYTAGGLPLQFPAGISSKAGMESYFRNWTPTAAPGAQRRYSNPSIGLLGHITALAMKGDFAGLIEIRILAGLGLGHSYIHVPKAAMADYAWGYNTANRPVRVRPAVFDAEAYGVKTTSADLIRFVEANIRPETLDAPLRRAVEDTHVGYFKVGDMVQGLGWEQYPYPVALDRLLAGNALATKAHAATPLTPPSRPSGPTLFNKTGSTGGFGAYVAFVPAQRIGIVMLANRNIPIPARITAAHAVLGELAAGAR